MPQKSKEEKVKDLLDEHGIVKVWEMVEDKIVASPEKVRDLAEIFRVALSFEEDESRLRVDRKNELNSDFQESYPQVGYLRDSTSLKQNIETDDVSQEKTTPSLAIRKTKSLLRSFCKDMKFLLLADRQNEDFEKLANDIKDKYLVYVGLLSSLVCFFWYGIYAITSPTHGLVNALIFSPIAAIVGFLPGALLFPAVVWLLKLGLAVFLLAMTGFLIILGTKIFSELWNFMK